MLVFSALTLSLNVAVAVDNKVFDQADIARGKAKSATCVACHGADGNSLAPIFPKIAGQNRSYLFKQLQEFKSGTRVESVMGGIVAALSDADMADLAAYFAAQKVSKGVLSSGKSFELGRKIYRGGKKSTNVTACIACHGVHGKGLPSAGFPALAAQHSLYISKQLKLFRQYSLNQQTGENKPSRNNDYEGMMINFTKNLTNKEIDAVSAYIAGLK
ncbi:MAG: cytochrome c4 [Candidatus Thioglobus sp.]|nr:MAG: cytochrome c4 [Candidatus Thioglobus sp.]